jgi:hypothetical protein
VHQPADVGGKLLRLWPGQQHAIVEGVQEPLFTDPAFLVDEDAVHDRDLPGRTAEREHRDAQPDPKGLAERDRLGARRGCCFRRHRSHADALPRDG